MELDNSKPGIFRDTTKQGLMRWLWRRYQSRYRLFLVFGLFFLVISALMRSAKAFELSLWLVPFFAVITGSQTLNEPGRDHTLSFLLSHATSRRQVWQALLLENSLQALAGLLPGFYFLTRLAMSPLGSSHLFIREAGVYLVDVIWALFVYLLVISISALAYRRSGGPDSRFQTIMVTTALLVVLVWGYQPYYTGMTITTVLKYGPLLAGTGLLLAALSYRAGWRIFRNLDI